MSCYLVMERRGLNKMKRWCTNTILNSLLRLTLPINQNLVQIPLLRYITWECIYLYQYLSNLYKYKKIIWEQIKPLLRPSTYDLLCPRFKQEQSVLTISQIKQKAFKLTMYQRRNHRENYEILWTEW